LLPENKVVPKLKFSPKSGDFMLTTFFLEEWGAMFDSCVYPPSFSYGEWGHRVRVMALLFKTLGKMVARHFYPSTIRVLYFTGNIPIATLRTMQMADPQPRQLTSDEHPLALFSLPIS
jgi:hypothetical protein